MTRTVVAFGDVKAQKKWSGALIVDLAKKSYFERKFISTADNSVIQRKTELESDAGDRISFDLCVQLRQKPTYGDNRLEGKAEALKFFTDEVNIDQMRHSVSAGGKMSRKRTAYDLRMIGKDRLGDYWARFMDEMIFVYLSGARGINQDFIEDTSWAGHGGNAIQAPDATHQIYGGAATSKASLASTDKMTRSVIEKALVKAKMMQATDPTTANMLPTVWDGEEHYVALMSEFQSYDLRTSTTGGEWLDIQKAAAAAEARQSPIFKGGLGMINNAVLHEHRNAIRFSDYGAGANVAASRALLLGRQAGAIAYGTAGGMRFDWSEETQDHGNEPVVASGTILGIKKTRFNGKDFGVLSIDTAAADPNP